MVDCLSLRLGLSFVLGLGLGVGVDGMFDCDWDDSLWLGLSMGGILDVDWEMLIESRVFWSRCGENKMVVWCDELS